MVKFSTLSGVLEARRAGARVVLQLPLNPPRPVTPASWAHLVEPARCGLPVTEVRLCPNTRKLMVRLEVRRTKTSFYLSTNLREVSQCPKVPTIVLSQLRVY